MKDTGEELSDRLQDIWNVYTKIERVDTSLPIPRYIEETVRTIDGDTGGELSDWYDEIAAVAEETPTEELATLFTDLHDDRVANISSSPIGVTVVCLIAVLIECRSKIPETPIKEVSEHLERTISTGEINRWDLLQTATEQTVDVARRTEVSRLTLDRLEGVDFVHPEESFEVVSDAVLEAHVDKENDTLRRLAYEADRSHRGEWEQADLRQYTDEERSGEPFEYLLAELWSELGYETTLTAGGNDGGVDIIGTSESEEILIQAKRYDSTKVSATEVRELAGLFPQYDFDHAMMVTSSVATEPANEEAARIDDLELIEGQQLANMLTESELHPPVTLSMD